jgi:hypothetical protein
MKLIFDCCGYSSWYLLPTIVFGRHGDCWWGYLLWLHGRLGVMREASA